MLQLYKLWFSKNKPVGMGLYKSVLLKYWVAVALLISIAFPSNVLAVKFYSINSCLVSQSVLQIRFVKTTTVLSGHLQKPEF